MKDKVYKFEKEEFEKNGLNYSLKLEVKISHEEYLQLNCVKVKIENKTQELEK